MGTGAGTKACWKRTERNEVEQSRKEVNLQIDFTDYSFLPNGLVFMLGIYSRFVHNGVKNVSL